MGLLKPTVGSAIATIILAVAAVGTCAQEESEVTVAMNWDDIHPDTPESMDIRKSVYRAEDEEGA